MNEKRIKKGFDFLAPFYDVVVKLFFGNSILNAQTHFLSEIKDAKSILIFGGGAGQILVESLKINRTAHYCYLDISPKMIELAKRKTAYSNIEFITGSYEAIPQQQFDIIITPFVLDCFNEKELSAKVIPTLKAQLLQNGKWLFSDFNYASESQIANLFSTIIIQSLYFVFNILCSLGIKKLPNFNRSFIENGFIEADTVKHCHGMLVSKIYANT